MKTVIDAVNDLKGDVNNVVIDKVVKEFASIIFCIESCDRFEAGTYHNYRRDCKDYLAENFKFVCTVDEFNACVDELSAATWIDGISIEQWQSGMKNTVIDSHGNELEIGKVYEFSDDQVSWGLFQLKGCSNVTDDNDYEYEANNCNWIFIRECQSQLGTIKKAPVKLVDGKAYQFESVFTGKIWVGFYNEDMDRFEESVGGDGRSALIGIISDVKNIIPLVPEVK